MDDAFAPLAAISSGSPIPAIPAGTGGIALASNPATAGQPGGSAAVGGPIGSTALAAPVNDFGHWFQSQLNQVNGQLLQVDQEMQTVALGGTQNLHQFMIHMEEAKLSFQLLVQVRNRLLESYQEVMRMQV